MANPLFAEARGGVRSPDFRDEDIARFFDSLALELAERLQAAPDSEASLTLLSVMKERPDLCPKYFEFVPIGLRDATPQAAVDVVGSLALMKAGPSADFKYDYQAMITNNEMSRFAQERDAVAEEWIMWASRTHHAASRLSERMPGYLLGSYRTEVLYTTAPGGGPRFPQRLGQLAIPLLPQISELLYLVRTLGSTIPRLADVLRRDCKDQLPRDRVGPTDPRRRGGRRESSPASNHPCEWPSCRRGANIARRAARPSLYPSDTARG